MDDDLMVDGALPVVAEAELKHLRHAIERESLRTA
jgi:hypothetical protein